MTLEATLDATADDGNLRFVFHVVNTDPSPVELTFRSGRLADVVVYEDENGEPIWRWSEGRMFTQAIQTRTLTPGETLEKTLTWEDPPSGEYVAVGTLEADRDLEARTTVSV